MAARTKGPKAPVAPIIYTPITNSTCGDAFGIHGAADLVSRGGHHFTPAEGCLRLPFHSKDHSVVKPRGLMTPVERKRADAIRAKAAAASKTPKAAKVKPLLRRTFKVGTDTWQVVVMPDGTSTSTKITAKPSAKVVDLPEAGPEGRDVQTQRTARRSRAKVADPTANIAISRASRRPKAAVAASA